MAEMKKLAVRKGDTVIVGSGDDKGKKARCLKFPRRKAKSSLRV